METYNRIIQAARTEGEWLRHYSHVDSRAVETFEDVDFYDRMKTNGYAKVYMPLHQRCPMGYVNGLNYEESKEVVYGPRNHEKGVYTALEYVIHNRIDGYIEIIENIKNR